jgi:hypothetical protein
MGNFRVFSAGFSIVVLGCTGEIGAGEPNAVVGQDTGGVTSGSGGVSHQDGSGGSASATSSTGGSSKGASSGSGGVAIGGASGAGNRSGAGGAGSGGAGGSGGVAAGNGGRPGAGGTPQVSPPHVVTACDKLGAVGVWENITPGGVNLSTFGTTMVSIIQSNTATVYTGTALSGLYRTNDCGATWKHVDTGTLGADLDKGSVSPLIDPIEPDVMYTGSLYGTNGLFKSIDGGVNWKSILTPEVQKIAPYGGFVGGLDMDPNNHLHVLVTWHADCAAPYTKACYAETFDGGTQWTLRNTQASWIGGEGTQLGFLDSDRWFFNSVSNGMWVSPDQGVTWNKIPDIQVSHGRGQLVRITPKGPFFMAGAVGVLFSADGNSWQLQANSGSLIQGLASDGTTVWSSSAFPYGDGQHPSPAQHYRSAQVTAPGTWSQFTAPNLSSGGSVLAYDPDHHLLYSANYWDGLYRVVVK